MGGIFSERSGVVNIGLEGMMLFGAFFAVWGSIWSGTWVVGLLMAMLFGGLLALIHGVFSIHLRADQIVSGFAVNLLALGLTGYLFSAIYPGGIPNGEVSRVPTLGLDFLANIPGIGSFLHDVFGGLSLLVWLDVPGRHPHVRRPLQDAIGLRIRSVGEHPRAADTVGISVYGVRYAAVVTSGRAGCARRRLPLDRLRRHLLREHDERPRLHRPRGGHLRQVAARLGVRAPRSSSGSALRSRSRSSAKPASRRTSSPRSRTS